MAVLRDLNGGGSPRIELAIDTGGSGHSNRSAIGYLGNAPLGGGCVTGRWTFQDMTDDVARLDLSQFQGGQTVTWDQLEAFFAACCPDATVVLGPLVDDGSEPAAAGLAYYDAVTFGRRTLENHRDLRP